MGTQWLVGMAGATGLNYVSLFRLMDELGLNKTEWRQLFDDIQVLEASALEAMSEQRD